MTVEPRTHQDTIGITVYQLGATQYQQQPIARAYILIWILDAYWIAFCQCWSVACMLNIMYNAEDVLIQLEEGLMIRPDLDVPLLALFMLACWHLRF